MHGAKPCIQIYSLSGEDAIRNRRHKPVMKVLNLRILGFIIEAYTVEPVAN